jgi:hypothetical protein
MNKTIAVAVTLVAFLVGFVAVMPAATVNTDTGVVTFAPLETGADTATIPGGTSRGMRAKVIILAPASGDKAYTLHAGTSTSGQVLWKGASKTDTPGISFNTTGTVVSVLTSSTAVQSIPVDFFLPPSVYLSTTDVSTPTLILHTQPSVEQ